MSAAKMKLKVVSSYAVRLGAIFIPAVTSDYVTTVSTVSSFDIWHWLQTLHRKDDEVGRNGVDTVFSSLQY